jgi:hypothetical protein
MKTEYKPIAMRCTKKQFKSIKDFITLPIDSITSFKHFKYLTNFYNAEKLCSNTSSPKFYKETEVIEEFNGEYFLDCCGREKEIEPEGIKLSNFYKYNIRKLPIAKVQYRKKGDTEWKDDKEVENIITNDYEWRFKPCSELKNSDINSNNRSEYFDKVINETLEEIKNLLVVKGKEYRRNNNPYHNFERGAELTGQSRLDVLQGFLLKHLISIEDIRNDLKKGILPSEEKVHEKMNDIIVYYLIEKAMILEQIKS